MLLQLHIRFHDQMLLLAHIYAKSIAGAAIYNIYPRKIQLILTYIKCAYVNAEKYSTLNKCVNAPTQKSAQKPTEISHHSIKLSDIILKSDIHCSITGAKKITSYSQLQYIHDHVAILLISSDKGVCRSWRSCCRPRAGMSCGDSNAS